MAKRVEFNPLDPLPSFFVNSQQELMSGAAFNFMVRVKPGAPTVLQVPAGPGNDQVGIVIGGTWRYVTAAVERAAIGGAARTLDLYATASADDIEPGDPAEIDNTIYAFDLALVEHNALPVGVDLARKVAEVLWSGTRFTMVDIVIGGALASTAGGASSGWFLGDYKTSLQFNDHDDLFDGRFGWLRVDGRELLPAYTELIALLQGLGNPFGVGPNARPRLADRQGRVGVMPDGAAGRLAGGALGEAGGAERHTLTIDEMPSHTHSQVYLPTAGGAGFNGVAGAPGNGPSDIGAITSTGGNGSHLNMQPYVVDGYVFMRAV